MSTKTDSKRHLTFECDYLIPGSNVLQTVCNDVNISQQCSDWEAFQSASTHMQSGMYQYLKAHNAEFVQWRVKNQDGHLVQDNTNVLTVFIKGRKTASP